MRIVMLTYDRRVDRRIFQEAETLITAGHEVILLAGWREGLPTSETVGRVQVLRIEQGVAPGNFSAISQRMEHVSQPAMGWCSRRVQRMIASRHLAPLGRFISWGGGIATRYARGLVNLLITIERRFKGWTPDEPLILAYLQRIAKLAPDVVHAHDLPLLEIAVRAKQERNVAIVYDAHELYPHQPLRTKSHMEALERLERRIISQADCVFTVNPFLAEEMERAYPGTSVSVIQNAIDPPDGFDVSQRFDRFREDYGLGADTVLALFQGGIAPGRNLSVAVRGMKHVTDPRFKLLIMGYGDYVGELGELAKSIGVTDRVVFVQSKSQDELLSYTASADIGLIPYPYGKDLNTHFVSPNKLYEFIVAGVPILTNDLPFAKMVVEDHGFGICRDLQTPKAFARALSEFPLESLPEFRANLLAGGEPFTWRAESRKLVALYEPVLEGLGGP